MKGIKTILLVKSIFFLISFSIQAQQLVYKPINPSFLGGDEYNGQWLLSSATSQNNLSESTSSTNSNNNLLNNFSSSLTQAILSNLSKKIVTDIFGENTIKEGTYEYGSYSVQISNVKDGLTITISDSSTGNQTEIFVPFY